MAPEQAEGRRESITTAVDVHALGAIFYELLAGRPPFRGDSVLEILRQVRKQEPVRPRSINPQVPRDLETIVLKCLEKSPQRRYHSAEALAADIDRWLANMPIQARPASPPERLVKWARRRPAAAALVALAVFSALATSPGDPRPCCRREAANPTVAQTGLALDDETQKRFEAESQLVDMEDDTYFKQLIAAQQNWENNNPVLADELLDRCPIRLRGWEWHHLRRRFHSELQTLRGHTGVALRHLIQTGRQPGRLRRRTDGLPALGNRTRIRLSGTFPAMTARSTAWPSTGREREWPVRKPAGRFGSGT